MSKKRVSKGDMSAKPPVTLELVAERLRATAEDLRREGAPRVFNNEEMSALLDLWLRFVEDRGAYGPN